MEIPYKHGGFSGKNMYVIKEDVPLLCLCLMEVTGQPKQAGFLWSEMKWNIFEPFLFSRIIVLQFFLIT